MCVVVTGRSFGISVPSWLAGFCCRIRAASHQTGCHWSGHPASGILVPHSCLTAGDRSVHLLPACTPAHTWGGGGGGEKSWQYDVQYVMFVNLFYIEVKWFVCTVAGEKDESEYGRWCKTQEIWMTDTVQTRTNPHKIVLFFYFSLQITNAKKKKYNYQADILNSCYTKMSYDLWTPPTELNTSMSRHNFSDVQKYKGEDWLLLP